MDDTYVIAELDIELRMFKYKTCRSFIASSFTFECFIHFQFSFASGWKDKEDSQPEWLTLMIPNWWYEFMNNVLLSVQ